jgi:hypothetical protein
MRNENGYCKGALEQHGAGPDGLQEQDGLGGEKMPDHSMNGSDMHTLDVSNGETSPEPNDRSILYPKGASTGLKRMLSDESFYSAKEETQVILQKSRRECGLYRCSRYKYC